MTQNPTTPTVSSERMRRRRRPVAIAGALGLLATTLALIVLAPATPAAAGPEPVMTGYVPLPAQNYWDFVDAVPTGDPSGGIDFSVAVTNAAAGAVITYDQWEDGFEADIANPVQSSTLVFGDGNTANGDASQTNATLLGCGTRCAGDLLPQGAVIRARNNVPIPRGTALRADGRDKVASTRGFAITAGGFAVSPGSVFASVVSAYDTTKYGRTFTVPVGQNTTSGSTSNLPNTGSHAFDYTGISIMASRAGTVVQVDGNGDGDLADAVDSTATIGEGQSHFVNGGLLQGAIVRASQPVQAHLLTGTRGSGYEGRAYTLFPDEFLSNDYLSPVGSTRTTNLTRSFLHNPGSTAITVTPTCSGCSGTISIPAQGTAMHEQPSGQAVRYQGTGRFIAIAAVGAGQSDAPNYDWGYPMVPTSQLTTQVVLGWAPGNSSNPPDVSLRTYGPVWVTSITSTTVRVDYDGDPTTGAIASNDCFGGRHDAEISVGALATTRITDPNDGDMTGARVYTCDGTALAGAWGEDPAVASVGAPGFDAGYTIVPTTTMLVNKTASLTTDTSGDGRFGPGDTMTYVISIADAGATAFTDVKVEDVLPAGLTYVPNSTRVVDVSVTPETSKAIADDVAPPAATVFPLDETGIELPDQIDAGKTVELRFDARITAPWPSSATSIGNTACVSADAVAETCDTEVTPLATGDVSLTKAVTGTAPTYTGDTATFTITARNDTATPAPGVVVTDVLPSGLSFVGATPSQGTFDSSTGVWTVGTIAGSGSATLQLRARVDSDAPITNYAQVTNAGFVDTDSQPNEGPLGPGNPPNQDDEASATVDVAPRIDLEVDKQVTSAPTANGTTSFRITVANRLGSTATGVRVQEHVPAGATFVSSSASVGSYDSGTGVWNVGTIAGNGSATLDVTYRLADLPTVNRAEVIAADQVDIDSQPDENPLDTANPPDQDDEDQVDVTSTFIDLSLQKSATSPAHVGEDGTFSITVTNSGPATATGVEVSDVLPAGTSFRSASATQGAYTSGSGTWTVGSLAKGASATLTITARLDVAGPVTNWAEVSDADQTDVDSTPGNGATTPAEDDRDDASMSATGASIGDHVWVDADGDGTLDAGEAGIANVTVTLRRDVDGDGTYETVVGTTDTDGNGDYLFTGLPAGDYRVTFDQGDIAGSWSPTTDTSFDVELSAGEVHLTADLGVTYAADLSLTKVVSGTAPTHVGDQVTFLVTVHNSGPNDATGVSVADALPAGLAYVSSLPSQGAYDADTGIWTVGALPVDESETLLVTARVTSDAPITNTAEVWTSNQPDPDSTPGNGSTTPAEDDRDDATVDVDPLVDVSLTKEITGTAPTHLGDDVTFTVTVANDGPSAATGVEVTDLLPAGLTHVSSTPSQGTYDAETGIWTVGNLAVDGDATLQVTATVNALTATNVAEVTDTNEDDVDSTPGNGATDPAEDDRDTATVTVDPLIDLSLDKALTTAPTYLGDDATFTITVHNAGPSVATGVEVTDLLPTGLTHVSDDSAGSYDPDTGVWDVGTVAVDGARTLTITATVDTLDATNVAEVTDANEDDVDSTPGNGATDPAEDDRDSVPVSVDPLIDLRLGKSSTPATVDQGQRATFTITVDNDGPSPATGVEVTDLLPAGLTYVSSTPSQGSYDAETGIWTVGDLAVDGGAELDIIVRVDAAGPITNVAEVSKANEHDVDSTPGNGETDQPEDDRDSTVLTSDPVIDLSLEKTVSSPSAHVGSDVTFTVTVANDGPSAATGVEVTDLLPAGLTYVSSDPDQGTYDADTGMWTVGDLAVDGDATLEIVATVGRFGPVTNFAQVTSADQDDVDSQPGENPLGPDDPADQDDEDAATVAGVVVDLSLDKSVDRTSVHVGDQATFTITVANDGPSPATGVVVSDVLPAGLTYVSSTQDTGSFDAATGTWTVGSLAVDGEATLTITVRVDAAGTITNVAEVSAAEEPDVDSTPGNGATDPAEDDRDTAAITGERVDLSLVKTVDDATPDLGAEVTYTLTLANGGPSTATGVVVVDRLPAGTTWVRDSSAGAYDPTTGTWTVGTVEDGGTRSITITVTTSRSGSITNRASVTETDQPDIDSTPGNDDPTEDDDSSVTIVTQPASVSGVIWLDADGDGRYDADEHPIPGVRVNLFDDDGDLVASTTTAADGTYSFTDLPPGDYLIQVDRDTLPSTVAGQTFDPDDVADSAHEVHLEAGDNQVHIDFGYEPAGEPPTPTPPSTPTTTTTTTTTTGSLPRTGSSTEGPARTGVVLLVVGMVLVLAGRRRRPARG